MRKKLILGAICLVLGLFSTACLETSPERQLTPTIPPQASVTPVERSTPTVVTLPTATAIPATSTPIPPAPTSTMIPPAPTQTPTPPAPRRATKAVDVSNWWAVNPVSDTKARIFARQWVSGGYGHLIAGTQFPSVTWVQLIAGQAEGLTTDIYVQLSTNGDFEEQMWEATQFPTWWMPITATWIAFETPPPPGWTAEQWITAAMDAAVRNGLPNPGIYTAGWWWNHWVTDSAPFAKWPLWYANYNGVPVIDWEHERFGAWERPAWKQYIGSTTDLEALLIQNLGFIPAGIPRVAFAPIPGGANVDLNVR